MALFRHWHRRSDKLEEIAREAHNAARLASESAQASKASADAVREAAARTEQLAYVVAFSTIPMMAG